MGVYSTSAGGERFDLSERTIAQSFQDAGYATAAFGKWHSGSQPPYHPNSRGFDEFYGFTSGHWGNYFSPRLEHNGEVVEGSGFIIDDLTDHALGFMREHQSSPWFVYVPLNTPHSPMQVPDELWDQFKDRDIEPDPLPPNRKAEDPQFTRAALALVSNIDANVDRMLRALQETDQADRTIVVFFCDNGPNSYRFNGGMRGRKGSVHEGGVRSPGLIRYPGHVPAGSRLDTVAGAVDLMPTLTELAGIPAGPTAGPLDGVSLADRLLQPEQEILTLQNRSLLSHWNGKYCLRQGDFRLHGDGTLYNVAKDRGEQNDVADQHPGVEDQMAGQLDLYKKTFKDFASRRVTNRPFPIADPGAEWTHLPARDAQFDAPIVRSNKYPNCSYLTGWTDPQATIRWPVQSLGEGDFRAFLYYAAQPAAVGQTLTLRWQPDDGRGDQASARVSAAAGGNFLSIDKIRSPQEESLVKDWGRMSLGTIHVAPGQGRLTLGTDGNGPVAGVEVALLVLQRVGS